MPASVPVVTVNQAHMPIAVWPGMKHTIEWHKGQVEIDFGSATPAQAEKVLRALKKGNWTPKGANVRFRLVRLDGAKKRIRLTCSWTRRGSLRACRSAACSSSGAAAPRSFSGSPGCSRRSASSG